MFYFDEIFGKKILRSDYLESVNAFFTTRAGMDFLLFESRTIISPVQTHSDNIEIVDERINYPNTDGLILKNNIDVKYLRFADCTPLIFYDTKQKIAAVSHAGWRGTAKKIGPKTVEKMESDPKDIIAVIGPTISLCCYEVSDDVKNQLLSTVKNQDGLCSEKNVDLKNINARQLIEMGVSKIDICPYCTSCNNELFYSYRKEKGTSLRHYAVAML